uniref:Biogenesis of lysosome-related organelles complex 1 subunit 2 n=1 Tax=Arcella intermedia TaxID=1963864 RepID=A0A6B2LQJ2_9EUKA
MIKQRKQQRREQQQYSHDLLVKDTNTLFQNLANYLNNELLVTSEDYKLLHQMNLLTKDKYADMTAMTSQLVASMNELQLKYKSFEPHLNKIDEIEVSVNELEKTVILLNEYTKKLEAKFQYLQRVAKTPYKDKIIV